MSCTKMRCVGKSEEGAQLALPTTLPFKSVMDEGPQVSIDRKERRSV